MTPLARQIAAEIAAEGPVSVAQFMTRALHDPRFGYYANRDPFGRRGDFVTAPEVSQMFGELIGLWCAEAWRARGGGCAVLAELGPGRGTLMADALRAGRVVPGFLDAIEVVLVEASPALAAVQRETLAKTGVRLRTETRFDADALGAPLFLVANEFFDALPIRQFVKTKRGWCERMVVAEDGRLDFALAPVPAGTALPLPAGHGSEPDGAIFEWRPSALALMEEIAAAIARNGGAALIVDYGHERSGFGDTLQAVKGHAYADILTDAGEADLSAHVDFAALAAAAARAGARAFGPVGQGAFLEALGIETRARRLAAAEPARAEEIASALRRLTQDAAMGRLFKVLAVVQTDAAVPAGFAC